jgi:hypothetical protein
MFKKIVVQTCYYNCEPDFVEAYIESIKKASADPKLDIVRFVNGQVVTFRTNDPASKMHSITTYVLEEQKEVKP